MTDHKDEAPARIGLISDPLGTGLWALATREEAEVAVHYIRADLAQSQIKAAEAAALMKAAAVAFHAALSELKHCASCDGDLAAIDVEIGASNVGCEVIDLISDDEPSPVAYVKAKVEELRSRAEAAEAKLQEAVDLIAGDKVGGEWKRACYDFLKSARAILAEIKGEKP